LSSKSSHYDRQSSVYYSLALNRISGVGAVLFKRLIEAFETPECVFQASESELKKISGMRPATLEAITGFREDEWAYRELDSLSRLKIRIISLADPDYPALLKTIYDPPPLLYVRGDIIEKDRNAIALVGSRNASAYGKEMTRRLARGLSRYGFTVVSGLARGIDTAAHQGALEAGGRTLAVLGSGIDRIYPWENQRVGEETVRHGALLSCFPLGAAPDACNFPARNRIISGLSLGVVIVEASFRSGSLITARLALDQGGEVFAVPGNVGAPSSSGTNRLIQEGAKLVTDVEDIVEEFVLAGIEPGLDKQELKTSGPQQPLNEQAKIVLDLLELIPIHIDDLIHRSGLPSSEVASLLLDLELNGHVVQLSGKMFKKVCM